MRNLAPAQNFQILAILKGLAWSIALMLVFSLIVSLLLHFTPLSELYLPSISLFIFFMSMLSGTIIGTRTAGCKGLLHGLSIALSFCVLTLAIGFLWSEGTITLYPILKRFAISCTTGLVGGIVGIGISSK